MDVSKYLADPSVEKVEIRTDGVIIVHKRFSGSVYTFP
jgi:hypothetical protein